MSYSPTLGRFLERDPIGYDDGMNLYEFVGGNPIGRVDPMGLAGKTTTRPTTIADVFDNPNDDPLKRIAEQAAGLGWIHQHLSQNDREITDVFVQTQIAILNALANGDCPCINAQEKQWLMNTVRDFIRPFSESLWERSQQKPITDAGWNQLFKDLDAGSFQKVEVPVAGIKKALPNIAERDAVARAMALNHINNDLKRALQNNGIGRQALWDCIGKVVDKASHQVIGPASGPGLDVIAWWDAAWDVSRIRDEMRKGISPPTTGTTTRPTPGASTRPTTQMRPL